MAGKLLSALTEDSIAASADLLLIQKDGESIAKKIQVDNLFATFASGGLVLGTPPATKNNVGGTPVKITEYDGSLPTTSPTGLTLDAVNGRITCTNAGIYVFFFTTTGIQLDPSDETYQLSLYENGVVTNIQSTTYTASSNENFARSFTWLQNVSAGDYYEMFVACLTGTEDIQIDMLQFFTRRIQ